MTLIRPVIVRAARGPLPLSLLAAVVLASAAPAAEASADAGDAAPTYVVHTCAGHAATAGGWHPFAFTFGLDQQATDAVDDCPSGGALRSWIIGTGQPTGYTELGWSWDAPPNTTIAGVTVARTATAVGPSTIWPSTSYTYAMRTYSPGDKGAGPFFDNCIGNTSCTQLSASNGGRFTTMFSSKTVEHIDIMAACDPPGLPASPSSCIATNANPAVSFSMTSADIYVRDTTAPTLTSTSGPLFADSGEVTGTVPFSVSATDTGGGIAYLALVIDGTAVQTFNVCTPPYYQPVPCPLQWSGSLSYNVDSLGAGPHTVGVTVRDATGVNAASSRPVTITVMPRDQSLTASLISTNRNASGSGASLTVPFNDRSVELVGTLSEHGQPLAGEPLEVHSQVADNPGSVQTVATTLTDGSGHYQVPVPAGPSRTLTVTFSGVSPSVSAMAELHVHAGIQIAFPRRVRRGRRILFRGAVLGGYVPAGGQLVELQARAGRRWLTFAVGQTAANGHFTIPYQFISGPKTIHTLRATVLGGPLLAWLTGSSSSARVLVY